HRALRDGGVPRVAAPGRPFDRVRTRRAQDGRAAAPDLRPDARAQVGDRDGRVRELRRDVQQLHDAAGRGQDCRRGRLRARLPAAAGAAHGRDPAPARSGAGRSAARVPAQERRVVNWDEVPGYVETREGHGETTIVVERDALIEACTYLRGEAGFNFLSDISA